jgi:hypothetical protein
MLTGATIATGIRTADPSGAPEFALLFFLVLVGFVLFILSNYMSSRF